MQGVSPWAGLWPLDLKSGAGTKAAVMAGVTTLVDTIIAQRVVVVVAPLIAAVGCGTAGADWKTAGQVETLPDIGQHKHVADLAELVTAVEAIVVMCVVVTHNEVVKNVLEQVDDGAETDGDGVANLKQPKGLIMFPSTSILLSSNQNL